MTLEVFQKRRFTVDEFELMAQNGIIGPDERVELIEGEIVQMAAIGNFHAALVKRLNRLLITRLGEQAVVGIQDPVRLSSYSQPQPDLEIARPRADDYASGHPEPRDLFLVIEVSHSTLAADRKGKVPFYARHSIAEVWLVNIDDRQVEVYREPADGSYRRVDIRRAGARLDVPGCQGVSLEVDEIFAPLAGLS